MKTNADIEKKLINWQKAYRVPDLYFDNLKQTPVPQQSSNIFFGRIKWALAASIILLFGLGYKIWFNKPQKPVRPDMARQSDLFSDLSEEEIIDYFVDNFETLPYDDIQL